MGIFFEEVKRAAIKREGKLNLGFFCIASYGGNPWSNRERHCWIVEKVWPPFTDIQILYGSTL